MLLAKDKKVRYRGAELAALHRGRLFCLSNGNLTVASMVKAFTAAQSQIERAAAAHPEGFWKVYQDGELRRTWP